jgi:RND superfamily putative drug exporter
VREGIASTARVITAAASVMAIVFLSFRLDEQRVVNLSGFGLAFAILVDATPCGLLLGPGHHGPRREGQLVDAPLDGARPAPPRARPHRGAGPAASPAGDGR